jgi:hypothetical protein
VRNTNDSSPAGKRKRASHRPGKDCPAILVLVAAASAGAEKRFELFTGNSVEPFAARRPKAEATGSTSASARCTFAPRKIDLLSGLM